MHGPYRVDTFYRFGYQEATAFIISFQDLDQTMTSPQKKLMQYWDKPEPPEEIHALVSTWRNDPDFEYVLYNHDGAADFIRDNFDKPTLDAFLACAIPAMQADYFRLCWLYHNPGIYVDADIGNKGKNEKLLQRDCRAYLFFRRSNLANDVMVFNRSQDPLIDYALSVARENVLQRKPGNVWQITGPGILTQFILEKGQDDPAFEGIVFDRVENLREDIQFNWELEYKKTPDHWTNVKDRSLYTD